MTSDQILHGLAQKHVNDVFVPECKDGPTQTRNHLRLDAWVMEKSWAHPRVVGYEIKVSRSDFLNDTKWPGYLPLCNELYFVAPKGLIQVNELSSDVGLIEALGSGLRLVTRKKAPYRKLQVPENVYRYILMCRAQIGYEPEQSRESFWKSWLAQKAENRDLGYQVSRSIREHVSKLEVRARELEQRFHTYDEVVATLKLLGFSSGYAQAWDVRRRAEAVNRVVPDGLKQAVQDLHRDLGEALNRIARVEQEVKPPVSTPS